MMTCRMCARFGAAIVDDAYNSIFVQPMPRTTVLLVLLHFSVDFDYLPMLVWGLL